MSDDSNRVEMIHPDLPDAVIRPKAGKTGAYEASGWQLKTNDEPGDDGNDPDAEPEPDPAEPQPEATSEPKKRRSAATDKKEA